MRFAIQNDVTGIPSIERNVHSSSFYGLSIVNTGSEWRVHEKQTKERESVYSQKQNLFIAEKYDEFKDVIDSKQKDVNTNRKKADAWQTISTQY